MSLLLNESTGSHLDASVSFVAHGSASFNPQRIQPDALTETGVGIAGFTAQRIQPASTGFIGRGIAAFNAVRALIASVSFAAAGTFSAIAQRIKGASVADTGVGAFTAQGQRIQSAAITDTGAGAFAAGAQNVLGASVSFAASSSFAAAATQIHTASVAFGAEAVTQFGEPPVPLRPNETGGYGFEKKDVARGPRKRHRILQATVAFAARASFDVRAIHVRGVADIPLFAEEPATSEVPVIPNLVAPLEPALIGHIEEWTDEDMLVALFMFEEAA
jgi:hypothetical protein